MTTKEFAFLERHFAQLHFCVLKAKQERCTEKFWGNHQCSKSCLLKKSVGYQSVCGVLICDEAAEPPTMECGAKKIWVLGVRSGPLSYNRRRSEHQICQHFGLFKYLAAQTIHFSEIRSFEFWFRIWITLTDELKMETSLPTVRQKSLDQMHISHEANAMFPDLRVEQNRWLVFWIYPRLPNQQVV